MSTTYCTINLGYNMVCTTMVKIMHNFEGEA